MTTRRSFMFGSMALTAGIGGAMPAVGRKILIILMDGFGPEYLEKSDMPNLKSLGRKGGYKVGSSVIPSVTNVNNASVVPHAPKDHGITTNYRYDRKTKKFSEMESSEFLLRPTIFEMARKLGLRTALVTSKDKNTGHYAPAALTSPYLRKSPKPRGSGKLASRRICTRRK